MDNYSIGDFITLDDGIYFGHEGAFIVYEKKIVAAFDKEEILLKTKWGSDIPYPTEFLDSMNPINVALSKWKDSEDKKEK